MTAGLLLALAAALPIGAFNCLIDEVAAVSITAGKPSASMIEGLPTDSLKFAIVFSKQDAEVKWLNSPIQASGARPVLVTAPEAGMILTIASGPCLFTEASCAAMFNYAKQPDGSLKILVTPTAVSFDKDHNTRFPFLVSMTGQCTSRTQK